MKSFFVIVAFLVSGIFYAQTTTLSGLSEIQAKTIADQIVAGSVTKWEPVSAKANKAGNYYNVMYINAAQPKDVKDGVRNGDSCEDCIRVTFIRDMTNGQLRFYEVWGNYADLFPAWKKLFRPDADRQKTAEDLDSQELRDDTKGVKYKFKKEEARWSIRSWS